jgi:predicted nucleotidyltransferase
MKESLLNLIFILSKVPGINLVFRFAYWLNAFIAIRLIKSHSLVDSLYIKGGYAKGDYELIVSDIDIVVISDKFKANGLLKILCPLVKDIDVYTETELELRLKYGAIKYANIEHWKCYKGKLPDCDYLFHPNKFTQDLIEEIYFYYEWLFENTKKGKLNAYRRACIIRNFKKTRNIVSELLFDGSIRAKLGDIAIDKCKSQSDFVKAFIDAIELIPYETADIEVDTYTKDNFQVADIYDENSNKIFLNTKLHNIFRSSGCLNTYDIYQTANDDTNNIDKFLGYIRYYFKILDGKTNHIHTDLSDIQLNERVDLAIRELSGIDTFNLNLNQKDRVIYITASWGNDYLNRLYETHQQNLKCLGNQVNYMHVSLGGDKQFLRKIKTLSVIRVGDEDKYKGLWHKESLFNLSLNFIKNARVYIFSDIDAVIPRGNWLSDLNEKFQKGVDAIQPFSTFVDEKTKETTYSSIAALEKSEEVFYAPGLMWAFSRDAIEKLDYLCDSFHDGSNDGVLFKEVTKTHIGMVETYDWINKKIESYITDKKFKYDYLDYELIHVSHPEPKHYINMIVLFNLVLPIVDKAIERSYVGLWAWKKDCEPYIKQLFSQFRKDRGYPSFLFYQSVRESIKELLASKIQKATLYLNDEKSIETTSDAGTLSMFVGQETKGMIFYCESLEGELQTNFTHKLEPFRKGETYSLSFIIECSENIDEAVILYLRQSHLDNVNFPIKKLTENLWYTTINFYAWEEFPEPYLDFEVSKVEKASLKFNHYAIETVPSEKPWDWFSELKGEVKEVATEHQLTIEAAFAPNWYKVVIKLDGEMSKYEVSVKDSHGTNVLLKRIQEPANDYMTFYFKSIVTVKSITFELNFDQACSYSHDIVIFH